MPDPRQLQTLLRRYESDYVAFVRDMFGVQPTWQQEKVLRAVTGEKHIAVRSGHGIGKSAMLSWIILAWMFLHPLCKIPVTAPTMHQLQDILWSEVAKWLSRSKLLSSLFEITEKKLRPKNKKFHRTWFATPVSVRKPENMQGFHADSLLFVVDEASGVPDEIFEVIEGALTKQGAKLVMAGNPTRRQGYFAKAFLHPPTRRTFETFHFSSADSPLVSREWMEKMKAKYGVDSNVYRVRVLGLFPKETADAVIPFEWLETVRVRSSNMEAVRKNMQGKKILGIDVARYGDDETVFALRHGNVLTNLFRYSNLDVVEIAQEAKRIASIYGVDVIRVETIGLGSGVYDALNHSMHTIETNKAIQLEAYDPRANPADSKFANLSSEAWWQLRELVKPAADSSTVLLFGPKISEETIEELVEQLSTRGYMLTPDGKIKIETKEVQKKKLGRSPDLADAVVIAFYTGKHTSNILYYPRSAMQDNSFRIRTHHGIEQYRWDIF